MTSRRALTTLLLLGLFCPKPAQAEPSWYKRKKEVVEEKAREEEMKASEKPVEMKPVELTPKKEETHETNYLFKKKGLSDSFGFDFGKLIQNELNGYMASIQYGMGWWWKPTMTLSGFVRFGGTFSKTFVFMMASFGPQLRYFPNRNTVLGVLTGYQFSQGLTRVSATHLPPPPNPRTLAARHGLMGGVHAGYLFWPTKSLAMGPVFNAIAGIQDERKFLLLTLGITFQSGRPDYKGDVTELW